MSIIPCFVEIMRLCQHSLKLSFPSCEFFLSFFSKPLANTQACSTLCSLRGSSMGWESRRAVWSQVVMGYKTAVNLILLLSNLSALQFLFYPLKKGDSNILLKPTKTLTLSGMNNKDIFNVSHLSEVQR